MHSSVYVGHLHHRRFAPTEHQFRYGLYMLYLDLDELPALIKNRVLRTARLAPMSFRREDHFCGSDRPLADAVRELVAEQTDKRPTGPVRLLTGLRCFGYYFSPLNLYYCFDSREEAVDSVVAEVSNTPWRETHYYVLSGHNQVGEAGELRFSHRKDFHVSPFMEMDMHYDWQLSRPGPQLSVRITNRQDSQTVFTASLALERRELSRSQLRRMMVRYPWMTGRIIWAIHYQAFHLWRKKCPFYPHPKHHGRPAPA